MVKLAQPFDPNEVPEDDNDYGPIPAGWYRAKIVGSDEYENKKKTGRILELQFQVEGPTHENRRIWLRLNYINKNATAQKIASQLLKKITDACGKPHGISTTEEIHGVPIMIRVKVKEDEGYEPSNEVTAAKKLTNPKAGAKPKAAKAQAKTSSSDEAGAIEPDEIDDDEIPF